MKVWITGCSSGLGLALVEGFVKGGHTVAGCARRGMEIGDLRDKFPDPHLFSAVDVSSDHAAADFCRDSLLNVGAPDLLINNAAIINPPAPLWEIGAEDFDRLIAINVGGTANMIRHTVPMMAARGSGMIVNLSSGWGRSTSPEVAPYCASKWAIEGLTGALAQELPEGVGAIALNPGIIDMDMLRSCFGEGAGGYRSAGEWAETAVPFLLRLTAKDNGASLTAP